MLRFAEFIGLWGICTTAFLGSAIWLINRGVRCDRLVIGVLWSACLIGLLIFGVRLCQYMVQ